MMHHDLSGAATALCDAATLLREVGGKRYAGWAQGFLGTTHALAGRFDDALRALDAALVELRVVGDSPREAHLLAFRAAVRARLGDEAGAPSDFARELVSSESRYHLWTLDLCSRQLDVLAGRSSATIGATADASRHFSRARELLSEIGWPRLTTSRACGRGGPSSTSHGSPRASSTTRFVRPPPPPGRSLSRVTARRSFCPRGARSSSLGEESCKGSFRHSSAVGGLSRRESRVPWIDAAGGGMCRGGPVPTIDVPGAARSRRSMCRGGPARQSMARPWRG